MSVRALLIEFLLKRIGRVLAGECAKYPKARGSESWSLGSLGNDDWDSVRIHQNLTSGSGPFASTSVETLTSRQRSASCERVVSA